jgi:hypothetical protein
VPSRRTGSVAANAFDLQAARLKDGPEDFRRLREPVDDEDATWVRHSTFLPCPVSSARLKQ